MEVASLIEGACSCYRGGHFNERRMIMLTCWPGEGREDGHVTLRLSL